jgi:hypothetical protein
MKRVAMILAMAASCADAPAAEFFDGNRLLAQCQSERLVDWADCLGYISGVHDALVTVSFCTPSGATRGQIRDVVVAALIGAPAVRHHSADRIVTGALRAAWPCHEQPAARRPTF